MQLVAYKSLVERNRERERAEGRPIDNNILYLPFVVVNTDKRYQFVDLRLILSISLFAYSFFDRTIVECNIASDKCEYVFNFDHPFEIQDDIEVRIYHRNNA